MSATTQGTPWAMAADELHVARQAVELGDGNLARLAVLAGLGQRGGELRAEPPRLAATAACVFGSGR